MKKSMLDFVRNIPKNGLELAILSDELWKIGSLQKIKELVTPELFNVHIGINMVGIWQSEGWWSILSENSELAPYVPCVLELYDLCEIKQLFLCLFNEEDHIKSSDDYIGRVENLDNITQMYFGYNAPNEGWGYVLDYLSSDWLWAKEGEIE